MQPAGFRSESVRRLPNGAHRLNDVDFVPNIHAVGDSLLTAVFADDILSEEPVGPVVRCSREADQMGVEILDHLPSLFVNRALLDCSSTTVILCPQSLGLPSITHSLFVYKSA